MIGSLRVRKRPYIIRSTLSKQMRVGFAQTVKNIIMQIWQ